MCTKKNIGLTLCLSLIAAAALALLYYHRALPHLVVCLPYLTVWAFLLMLLLCGLILAARLQRQTIVCLLCWGPWLAVASILTALWSLLGLAILSRPPDLPTTLFVFLLADWAAVMIASFVQLLLGLIEELLWIKKGR
jgi:hypothetical protein